MQVAGARGDGGRLLLLPLLLLPLLLPLLLLLLHMLRLLHMLHMLLQLLLLPLLLVQCQQALSLSHQRRCEATNPCRCRGGVAALLIGTDARTAVSSAGASSRR
jgi:hypothetical protein